MLCILTPEQIAKQKIRKFAKLVYTNFIDLAKNPDLKHNITEIERVLYCKECQLFVITEHGKMIGYLLGEIMDINDGRKVFYITYIFTAKNFRNKGIASQLMNLTEQVSRKLNLDGILLTCDTEDQQVFDFYAKRGFMPDVHLRKYDKYDVLYKIV